MWKMYSRHTKWVGKQNSDISLVGSNDFMEMIIKIFKTFKLSILSILTSKRAKKSQIIWEEWKRLTFIKRKSFLNSPLTCRGWNWPGIFLVGEGELCSLDFPECNLYWFTFVGVNHLYSDYSPRPPILNQSLLKGSKISVPGSDQSSNQGPYPRDGKGSRYLLWSFRQLMHEQNQGTLSKEEGLMLVTQPTHT